MNRKCWLLLVLASSLAWRTEELHAAEPTYRVSSMMFTGSLSQVVSAIANAFANGTYHGMKLGEDRVDYVMRNGRETEVPKTTAWILDPQRIPLTLLPQGKKMVAYREYFELQAEAVAPDRIKVSIKPAGSAVTDDHYELSMHLRPVLGGKYHPPVPDETTKLFARVEKQLREIRAGSTNALPATLDTLPGFYRDFWTAMDVKEQHDSRNWNKMVGAWKAMQAAEAGTNGAAQGTSGSR